MLNQRVIPSRSQLQMWKLKLAGAKKGYDLLKRKLDGLKKKFNEIMRQILLTKMSMGGEMGEALFALAEAQWGAGEFGKTLADTVKRASLQVQITQTNAAGVFLPFFQCRYEEGDESMLKQLGLGGGGAAISKCKDRFHRLIKNLIVIAGYQMQFITLDEVIKITSRRVNALENVVIPRVQNNIAYIIKELDEMDREDFFRLKKVQEKKKKHIEQERVNREKHEAETGHIAEPADILGMTAEEKDEDVIF